MDERKYGFDLITLAHLLKRERDRANEVVKQRVLGPDNKIMCTDLGIIQFLADNSDKEIYQKDIEHFFSLTAPSVSNKLRDLQKKGLVDRVYSKVDTRLKQVIMTEKAWDVDRAMRNEIATFESRILNALDDNQQKQLGTIIEKLRLEFE